MPASIAWAMDTGIACTNEPSRGHRPVATTITPTRTKAPIAAAKPPSGAAVPASSAAPGVDHASVIGIRYRRDKNAIPIDITRHSANNPEAACSEDAPTARNPVSTTANELVKPTSAVTTPAIIGCP